MPDFTQPQQPQQPTEPQATPPAQQPAQQQPQTTQAAPEQPTASLSCQCVAIDPAEWDKQKKTIEKTFIKTFSPRIMFFPFSFAIDVARAKGNALKKEYKVPKNPMILDEPGMFWGTVWLEVEGADPQRDASVMSLSGKEFYTKTSTRPWKEMKKDLEELTQEFGKNPDQIYVWYTSCPKCEKEKDIKTVYFAA